MNQIQQIDISKIVIGNNRRVLKGIDELVDSINEIGLLNPIQINQNGKEYRLIAGYHRLEACKRLGWQTIDAIVLDLNETEFELAEIDENLMRNELTEIERGKHNIRRKALYERLHPETKSVNIKGGPGRGNKTKAESALVLSFVADTAEKTGRSETSIKQSIRIGRDIIPEVQEKIIGTPLENEKTALLEIAKLSPEEQKQVVEKCKENPLETKKAIKEIATQKRRKDRVEKINKTNEKNTILDSSIGKFSIIYADPPWRYDFSSTDNREIENQYPTMSLEEICNLPVAEIASDDCVLFLWSTWPKLVESLKVIDSWGFKYVTGMVWGKDKIGMGYYAREKTEFILIAKKGNLPVPEPQNRPDGLVMAPRTEHSKKPKIFYEIIDKMYPEFEKIELFCREPYTGWKAWGNQI